MMHTLSLVLGLLLATPAHAGQLAGVTLPDSDTIAGTSVVLNGLGLREKFFIDVYVGGLYLPAKTRSSSKAINDDVTKRIVMHFVYSEVSGAKLAGAFDEGLVNIPNGAAVRGKFDTLNSWMATVHSGDEIYFDYVPGSGTTVWVKGVNKGTITGVPFMQALWGIYLGPYPPTAKLKKGMMTG